MTSHHASGGALASAVPRFVPAGVAVWLVPPALAAGVVAQARAEALAADPGLRAQRVRLLPPLLGVYFTLALCLSSALPGPAVLHGLCGLRPASAALTRLRRRLGPRPLELLFRAVAGALSPGTEPWSHACGLLLAAWDGTTLKLPASEQNRAWAGRWKKSAHYPRARLVALVACGTRALIAAAAGPTRAGERALARDLLGHLRAGMLLLADRGFCSWDLWHEAAATGAQLLWRMKSDAHLPVVRELPDGSWLTRVNDPAQVRLRVTRERKRKKRPAARARRPEPAWLPGAAAVRVIEFTLTVTCDDGSRRTGRYRLITTLLDPVAAPAAELAAAYARRWAAETCFSELKTRLRGPGRVLRSRTPDLALQEIWAYLVAYQVIRAVIALTAAGHGLDPARLSFTTALNTARACAGLRPEAALARAEADLLASQVPARPGRVRPRAAREPGAAYPKAPPGPISSRASYAVTVTTPDRPPPTTREQPEHPPSQPKTPP